MNRWFRGLIVAGLLVMGIPAVMGQSEKKPAAEKRTGGKAAGKTEVSGMWNLTVESSQGTSSPQIKLVQEGEKLSGDYKGMFGESKLTGTLKGNEIKFSVPINAQGMELTLTYTGTLEKDGGMKGTVSAGDLGSGTWTAARAKPEDTKK